MSDQNARDAKQAILFELPREQATAPQAVAAGRKVRITGEVRNGRLVVDAVSFANEKFSQSLFVSVNAPFKSARATM
jgi:hypothetical protein